MEVSVHAFQKAMQELTLPAFLEKWSEVLIYVPFIHKQPEDLLLPAERETPHGNAYMLFSSEKEAEAGLREFGAEGDPQVTLKPVALGELARNACMADMKLVWVQDQTEGLITDDIITYLGCCTTIKGQSGRQTNYRCTPLALENKEFAGQGALLQLWFVNETNQDGSDGSSSQFKVFDDRVAYVFSEDDDLRARSSLPPEEQALFDRWAKPTYFDSIIRYSISQGIMSFPESDAGTPEDVEMIIRSLTKDMGPLPDAGAAKTTNVDSIDHDNMSQSMAPLSDACAGDSSPASVNNQDKTSQTTLRDPEPSLPNQQETTRSNLSKVTPWIITITVILGASGYWMLKGAVI